MKLLPLLAFIFLYGCFKEEEMPTVPSIQKLVENTIELCSDNKDNDLDNDLDCDDSDCKRFKICEN